MITWMQHNKKYLIVTIWVSVIALVGAGLVGWGSLSFSSKSNTLVTVGKHDISISSYQKAYQNYFNYFNSLYNNQLTEEMAEEIGLRKIVIDNLIDEALLLNFADEMGIVALESDLADLLTQNSAFHDSNGKFNKDIYYKVLKNSGLNTNSYEEILKKEAILKKVTNIFNIPATKGEEETFGAALLMKDKISISTISVDDSEVSVSDNETLTYWEVNKNSFLTEKEYEFDLVHVPVFDGFIDENDIKAHYEETKYFYKDAEEKILSYDEVKPQIENSLRLKLAEKNSYTAYLSFKKGEISPEKSIVVKESTNEYNVNEFQNVAVGDFVKPIEKSDGYDILKLTKVSLPAPKAYEEAKNEVKQILLSTKKADLINSKAQSRVSIFEGTDVGYIDRSSNEISNLDGYESMQLVNKVFGTKEKYGYIVLNDKAILYKITDQKLPSSEDMEENKQAITQLIEQIKTNETRSILTKELKNRYKITQYFQG